MIEKNNINKYSIVPNSLCELRTTLNNIQLKWRKSIQFRVTYDFLLKKS
jgi:hypothetical protein